MYYIGEGGQNPDRSQHYGRTLRYLDDRKYTALCAPRQKNDQIIRRIIDPNPSFDILLFYYSKHTAIGHLLFFEVIRCWVWVLLPSSFSSKYCCLTPRLCGHVDHIDLLLWATPSVRRYGGSRVVYILQQLLYETTRPAITGIWRGGWPSAISYCILVDHGGLEWRSKTMGQQNHLFGWYGKMANWNFSLLRYQHHLTLS